jgi:hypothetical protein
MRQAIGEEEEEEEEERGFKRDNFLQWLTCSRITHKNMILLSIPHNSNCFHSTPGMNRILFSLNQARESHTVCHSTTHTRQHKLPFFFDCCHPGRGAATLNPKS